MTTDGPPGPEPEEQRAARRSREKYGERHMWMWLAYFLFGIHFIAFVMIYAVTHATSK
ncbi:MULTISPECIES: hypothetical protein [unclassified Streptomyces]|uniref:hypothetical protein n=1 Tax=unclassified Streptomyces TaxID=2593676 RepID=UPI000AEEE801|nr:hypothetical protein [Streptomyces sp. TSRI0107]